MERNIWQKPTARTVLLSASCLIAMASMQTASAKDYNVPTQEAYASALAKVQPGDRIILKDGEWKDFQIEFTGTGTEEAPITLMPETPGGVVLTGDSNLSLGGDYLHATGLVFKDGFSVDSPIVRFKTDDGVLANNSRVSQTVIDGFSKPKRQDEDYWIVLHGRENQFDHNFVRGKTNKGATLIVRLKLEESQQNNHKIEKNYFGYRSPLGGNGGETIRIGVSQTSRTQSGTLITQNLFEKCDGEVEIISIKSEGNTVSENLFFESRGSVVFRHGGGNVVERNIFLGNGVADTGGVRVINERQTVRENYFEGLRGSKFMGALVVMNGVPNSPENRYHQVQDANIVRNSFIDVTHIGLGTGADEERSADPKTTRISQNLLTTSVSNPVVTFTDVSGISSEGNISSGGRFDTLKAELNENLKLHRAANGLLYPENAGLEAGAPSDLKIVDRTSVGPNWYSKPELEREAKIWSVSSSDELINAVNNASSGDEIQLAGGRYEFTSRMALDKEISLVGEADKSVILKTNDSGLFELKAHAGLKLTNISLLHSSVHPLLEATGAQFKGAYKVHFDDVSVIGNADKDNGPLLKADPETFASSVVIENSSITHWHAPVFQLSGEGLDGWYLADMIRLQNNKISNVTGPLAVFGRMGRDESTFGPKIVIKDSQFENVAKGDVFLDLHGIDSVDFEGNDFVRVGDSFVKRRVLGYTFAEKNNNFVDTKTIDLGLNEEGNE